MVSKSKRGVKIIKKTGKVLAWIFGILLLLGIGSYFALKSPACQTWMAQRAASYFSTQLHTKVTIRAVNIEFFKTVDLEGIYVEDQHGDTLLYADKLKADIHRFDMDNHYLSISLIKLSDSKIKIKKYAGEHGLSYRFIQKYFQSADTTKKKTNAPWKVDLGGIALDNITFAYVDTRDTINDPGMDYENIRVTGVAASVSDIDLTGDSLSLRIKGLKGTERCGLALKDFSTRMTVTDSMASLDNLHFITRGSSVDGFVSFRFNSTDDIADDFIHLVTMNGHISNSVIEMGEVAYFAPELLGIKKKILFTGDVKGKVDHLRCNNVDLRFGEVSHIAGNFSFDGLPKIEETDMNFKIREAVTNRKDLEGIPSYPFGKGGHLAVDENIGKLGNMVFAGSFEGFINDFVAHGNLNTAIGSLKLDNVAMTRESDTAEYSYVGEVHANHFNIGYFYSIPDLTYASGDVNVNGVGLANATIRALLDGSFSELVYHGYSYTGITVSNGKLRKNVFDGIFKVDDPNLKMGFHGIVDNSKSIPNMKFDANIKSANLGELNFLDKSHEYLLSADFHMNFTGSNIDNIEGVMRVDSMNYSKDGGKFKFNEILIVAGTSADKTRGISLTSDIVDITISGKFKLMALPHAVSDMLSAYLPSYFPPDNDKRADEDPLQQFTWFVNFQNNTKPIQAIIPELSIAPNTNFNGKFDSRKKLFNTSFTSPSITYKDIVYNGIQISAGNSATTNFCQLTGTLDQLQITDTVGTKNMSITCIAKNDSLQTNLKWNNETRKLNDANINGLVHFESQKSLQINFDSTELHLNDSLWTVSPGNYMRIDSNRITFHQLVFHSGDASIGLDGKVSKNPTDELTVNMKNFNIAYLNYFSVPRGITLGGVITSETKLSNLYETPIFNSNTTFKDFYVNGQKFGDGELNASWLQNKQAVYLHGNFTKGITDTITKISVDNILFEGYYYPKNKENSIDINASFVNIPLDVLTPVLKDYCSMMKGQIGGDVHITGTPSKPLLNGTMNVFIRRVIVDYLGLAISAPMQTVTINENSFFFDDFKITDGYSDTAKIYGNLFHTNFSKFQFDMDFSFDHFMVLNTNANQNEAYFGRVFASGYMNIFGYVDDIVRIDMNAKTEKIVRGGQTYYSEFNIPMSNTSEVSSSDFISFEDHTKPVVVQKTRQLKNNGIELHLNVEATDDAIVKVIFDQTVGDELTAYGNGNLKMDITPSGDFSIFGRYEVEKGNYLFTMKNVILVPFELAKGGDISWNGDPYKAQINADAVYKTTASVEPFFPGDSLNKAYQRSYPTNVVMHLDNNLMNPDVSFDINLPTADQNIQETVRSYTQTDLEKNRQVLSLMVLNSFMTPSELREGTSANTNVAYGTSATLLSNFVSGTMNNWLSQINSDFNMGMKYRSNDDMSPEEIKVYLGTQLMNNRITIDGNVGKINANQAAATSATTNGQWVGDVNVEYKVTDDGKVRLRAFNRSNDNTIATNNAAYTQGVGIFYREEFESGAQLKKRYRGYFTSKKKKEAEKNAPQKTPAPAKDSTSTK